MKTSTARFALVALAILSIARTAGPQGTLKAFTGAIVFDGSGRTIADATIVVRDGRIVEVARGLRAPAGAEVIQLGGQFVMPGLINAHGHVNTPADLRTYAAYGVTTVVSLGGESDSIFAARAAQDVATLDRARVYVAGPVLTPRTPDEARAQVARVAAQRVDWVKIRVDDNLGTTTKMPADVWRAVIEEAHRRSLRVAAHVYYLEDARALVAAGVDFVAHSVRDRDVDDAFVDALRASRRCYSPTLMREVSTFVYESTPAFFSDPAFLAHANQEWVAALSQPARQESTRTNAAAQRYKAQLPVARRNLKRLFDARVPIAMGTDTGPMGRFQGWFELMELELMVEAGLRPVDAILAATRQAARCMGLDRDLGTLTPGKWADFVVLPASPVTDIANVKRIRAVYIAGNRVNTDPPIRGFSTPAAIRQHDLEGELTARLSRDSTGAFFREFTRLPHPAGSARNRELAEYVAARYRAYGLEDVRIHRYDVLLPWPTHVSVTMTAPTRYDASLREDPVAADPDTRLDPGPAYLGMSASGDVTAELVYAGSGNPADYDWLEAQGVDLRGKVAIVRYSVPYSYRGYKAQVAQQRGLRALLIYSDPQEDGYRKGLTFPDGPYGPDSHLQRGALTYDFIIPGDPLTPGWASVDGARRIPVAEARSVPTIMAVPLSWRDAQPLLKAVAGPVAPPSWQGALPFTYRTGPGPATVRVRVAIDDSVRAIYVVEGRIRGSEEPEQYVVLGNHRDAWVFGGVDPSSGSATQLELARVLGALAREGKRPRRSIVFASWDAEEWHLTGSTEWGEQFADDLRRHAIAYLNVDGSTSGSEFSAGAVASLNRLVVETVRDVRDPASGGSVLTAWARAQAGDRERTIGGGASGAAATPDPVDLPGNELGSGSDYTVFLNFLGVPIVEMSFDGPYGVYHSMYDNYYWMTRFGDPGFRYMTAMADVWGRMALRLANAEVLPFDFGLYASRVDGFAERIAAAAGAGAPSLDAARAAIHRWKAAAATLERRQATLLNEPPGPDRTRRLRELNDALRSVEQQFLLDDGIPGRPWFKHVLYAPRPTYAAMMLPGIQEAIDEGDPGRASAQAALLAARLNAVADLLERVSRMR